EESLELGVRVDDGIEILRTAHHHFAPDDGLDAIFGDPVARQDGFAGETKRDDLPAARRIALEFREDPPAHQHHFVAPGTGLAEGPTRFDLNDAVRHLIEEVRQARLETCGDQRLTQSYASCGR